MDADTKRGADERDEIARGFGFVDHAQMLTIMARHGLHVVTAAEKAVLDAMRDTSVAMLEELIERRPASVLADACRAELARREAAK